MSTYRRQFNTRARLCHISSCHSYNKCKHSSYLIQESTGLSGHDSRRRENLRVVGCLEFLHSVRTKQFLVRRASCRSWAPSSSTLMPVCQLSHNRKLSHRRPSDQASAILASSFGLSSFASLCVHAIPPSRIQCWSKYWMLSDDRPLKDSTLGSFDQCSVASLQASGCVLYRF